MRIPSTHSVPAVVVLRRRLRGSMAMQLVLIVGLWLLAEALVRATGLPLPGGVVGMAVLLLLLGLRWVAPRAVAKGAGWLLAEMLLFFVPAAMILMQQPEMLGLLGLKLLAVIAVGTTLVMASTALTIDLLLRWRQGRARH